MAAVARSMLARYGLEITHNGNRQRYRPSGQAEKGGARYHNALSRLQGQQSRELNTRAGKQGPSQAYPLVVHTHSSSVNTRLYRPYMYTPEHTDYTIQHSPSTTILTVSTQANHMACGAFCHWRHVRRPAAYGSQI